VLCVGILPTFGPSWINLYGSGRQFKVVGGDEELNEGIGDTPAFRGRLLVGIDTTIVEGEIAGKSTVRREPLLRSSAVVSPSTLSEAVLRRGRGEGGADPTGAHLQKIGWTPSF